MNNLGKKVKFSELFEGLLWFLVIMIVLMLKYILPSNEFVKTYFTGFFALLWLAIILVLLFIRFGVKVKKDI
jgi:hypothetical protein